MAITIRRAAAGEAGVAVRLWLRARRAAGAVIPAPVHSDDAVRAWFASHVSQRCELWLAEDGTGEIAGLLVLDDDWVDQLYVAPELTGCGVGGRLLALAKRERPDGLRLWTFEANAGARRFYERHGFVEAGWDDGTGNEEGAPAVHYAWTPED